MHIYVLYVIINCNELRLILICLKQKTKSRVALNFTLFLKMLFLSSLGFTSTSIRSLFRLFILCSGSLLHLWLLLSGYHHNANIPKTSHSIHLHPSPLDKWLQFLR